MAGVLRQLEANGRSAYVLGVVSKKIKLLHGRVGDSTCTSVNSLSPQMSELVEDAVAS